MQTTTLFLLSSILVFLSAASSYDYCKKIGSPSKHCSCSNNQNGFTFGCSINVLGKDNLDLSLAVSPCAVPASAKLNINDTKFHLHQELAGLVAGKAIRVPFLGLSLNVDKFKAGVMIDFDLEGSAEELDLSLGIDLCASVNIFHHKKTICGSKLDHHLPIKVLHKSYNFSGFCDPTNNVTNF
jgi:hypothetical protein